MTPAMKIRKYSRPNVSAQELRDKINHSSYGYLVYEEKPKAEFFLAPLFVETIQTQKSFNEAKIREDYNVPDDYRDFYCSYLDKTVECSFRGHWGKNITLTIPMDIFEATYIIYTDKPVFVVKTETVYTWLNDHTVSKMMHDAYHTDNDIFAPITDEIWDILDKHEHIGYLRDEYAPQAGEECIFAYDDALYGQDDYNYALLEGMMAY